MSRLKITTKSLVKSIRNEIYKMDCIIENAGVFIYLKITGETVFYFVKMPSKIVNTSRFRFIYDYNKYTKEELIGMTDKEIIDNLGLKDIPVEFDSEGKYSFSQ